MCRALRFLVVVFGAVSLLPIPVGSAQAAASPWEYAEQCASQPDSVLDVQMMVDVSLSLRDTDPLDLRKSMARNWLLNMISLSNRGLRVRVALASYGTVWTSKFEWADFDIAAAERLNAVIDELPRDEYDTDHVGALIEASRSLDSESLSAKGHGLTSCPLLLWFTDGQYDFDGKSPEFRRQRGLPATTIYSDLKVNRENESKIMEAGLRLSCDAGGVVDQLRKRRTNVVAIALSDGKVDFRLVEEMATGRGFADGDKSGRCDTQEYNGGSFGPPDTGSPPPPPDPCEGERCSSAIELSTSPLATAAQLDLRLTGIEGSSGSIDKIRVVDPGGSSLVLRPRPGEQSEEGLGSATVSLQSISAASAVITLTSNVGARLAEGWRVEVDRTEPQAALQVTTILTTDLRPRLVSPVDVRAGTATDVVVEVVHSDGGAISGEDAGLLEVTLNTGGGEVTLSAKRDGNFTGVIPSIDFPKDEDSASFVLTVSTQESVSIPSVPFELPIVWPGYPTVRFIEARNGVVKAPRFDSPGSATVSFEVVAPSDGEGCARLVDTQFTTPEGEVGYSTTDSECVPAGGSIVRDLVLTVADRRESSLCGDVGFSLTGEQTTEPRKSVTTVCVSTLRSATPLTKVLAILGLVLGAALPLLMLRFVNSIIGRMPNPSKFQMAQNTVAAVNGNVRNVSGRGAVVPDDFAREGRDFGFSGNRLVLAQQRVEVVIRRGGFRYPLLLLTGPQAHLSTSEPSVVVGHGKQVLHRGALGGSLQVPLGLDGVWFLTPSLAGASGGLPSATLVVLRVIGAGSTKDSLAQDVRSAVDADDLERLLSGLVGGIDREDD